jgi:DNA uptake protein ComE-like DNA-binding protein
MNRVAGSAGILPASSGKELRRQDASAPRFMERAGVRSAPRASGHRPGEQASVLIIVLWVAFGLVALALYFAHSMSFEMRAADNRVAAVEAEQAIAGATRYVTNILTRLQEPGLIPDAATYRAEAVPVGTATFWLIGRSGKVSTPNQPVFGLVDEASKLNLNVATLEMLETLPRMTPELAAAIIDWRDANDDVTQGGAESETYLRRSPAYRCKNADFESMDELRLVLGTDLDILFGDDANLNGVLDPNENDATVSLPNDNRDGQWDPGLFEYLTVYSRQPSNLTNVNNRTQLGTLLTDTFGADRANQILPRLRGGAGGIQSLLQFYIVSEMTSDEFFQIEGGLTVTNGAMVGLVNVNTASEAVLACLPGIGTENAPALVAYRQTNPDKLNSVAWVKEVLPQNAAFQAGPYLTGRSYQLSADIAAVGHHGRGYRRVKFVFDTSEGAPKIRYRQDLTHLGWALGRQASEALLLTQALR